MEKELLILNSINIIKNETNNDRILSNLISLLYIYLTENKLINKKEELLKEAKLITDKLSLSTKEELFNLFSSFNKKELGDYLYELLNNKQIGLNIDNTNKQLSELVFKLLDIKNDDTILDLGSGNSSFLLNIFKLCKENNINCSNIIGLEINKELISLSKLILSILSLSNISIKENNNLDNINLSIDKAYCFPPMGLKKLLNEDKKSSLFNIKLTNKNSSEFIFIDSLLSSLSKNGKAIVLINGNPLFNDNDKEYRNNLIKNGLIESIIELPIGSLSFSSIKPYIIVFSFNNKGIKFVDATSVIESNKRYVNIDLPVNKIMELYNSSYCYKENSELIDNDNLTPSSINVKLEDIKNGVTISSISEIFIGSQYTLSIFEKKGLLTKEKTNYKILTSSDIEDGLINYDKLHYIDYKDSKFDKFRLFKGDLVISSKSSKVKIAVIDKEINEKVLVTGGMIIIRPNLELINPTYLKMFLDSKNGQDAIKSIQKGNVIVTINSKNLGNIVIPLLNLDKQNELVDQYNDYIKRIINLKKDINNLEQNIDILINKI